MNRGVKHRDHRDNDCRDNVYTEDFDRSSTTSAKRLRKDEPASSRRSGASPSSTTSGQITAVDSYYKTLILSPIDLRLPDEDVNTMIYREFKKFGEFNVSLTRSGAGDQRLAYIDFRYPEDAKQAKHSLQGKLVVGDTPIRVEAVYTHGTKIPPPPTGGSHPGGYRCSDAYRENSAPMIDGRLSKDRFEISGKDRYESERYDKFDDNGLRRKESFYNDNPALGPLARLPSKDRYKNDRGVSQGHRDFTGDRVQHSDGPHFGGPLKYNNKVDSRYHQQNIYPEDDETATRTLFVGNLEWDISEDELRSVFQHYGQVEDVDIKRSTPGRDGGWRGDGGREGGHGGSIYAFIRFHNLDMAHIAKVEMTGRPVRSNMCKIGYGKVTQSTCVWVGGIGPWVGQEDVIREINKFVPIIAFNWPRGKNYAYAVFKDVEEARAAMKAMRGRELGGAGRRVRVDFADISNMEASPLPPIINQDGFRRVDYPDLGQRVQNVHVKDSGSQLNDYSAKVDREFARTTDQRVVENDRGGPPYRMYGYDDLRLSGKRKLSPSGEKGATDIHQTGHGLNGGNVHSRLDVAGVLRHESGVDASLKRYLEDATSFSDVSTRAPAVWTGALTLKNSAFTMRMYLLCGDERLVDSLMVGAAPGGGETLSLVRGEEKLPMLKVGQRLRMDAPKLDEVRRRMFTAGSHGYCVLLALPSSTVEGEATRPPDGWVQRPLKNLVLYLKQKDAAGIVSLPPDQSGGPVVARDSGLLHAFPSGDFARELLTKYAPRVSPEDCSRDDHLVVLVVRV